MDNATKDIDNNHWAILLREGNIERFNQERVALKPGAYPDLSLCDLRDLHLEDVCLAGANLAGSDLSGCDLRRIDFTGANLSGVNFAATTFTEVSGLTLEQLSTSEDVDPRLLDALRFSGPAEGRPTGAEVR